MTRSRTFVLFFALATALLVVSCRRGESAAAPSDAKAAAPAANAVPTPRPGQARKAELVVEEFGRRLKDVPTTATPEIAAKAIREKYSGLVDPLLVETWAAKPATAPGRPVSSPWPERIEIVSSTDSGAEAVVIGAIVETSSTGVVRRVPVEIRLRPAGDSWLIAAYAPI